MRISDWSSDVCSSDLVLALAFFLDDDLGQHRAGDVLARLRVVDDEILAVLHHLAQMVEGDVAARRRIVQPPVGVFLDCDRRAVAGLALAPVCRPPVLAAHDRKHSRSGPFLPQCKIRGLRNPASPSLRWTGDGRRTRTETCRAET